MDMTMARKFSSRPRIKDIEHHDMSTMVDAKSAFFRRHGHITRALFLDQGGADHCSESHKQLIKRFATAAALAEQMEARLALGLGMDPSAYSLLCNTLVRVARVIGIGRTKRDLSPRLADFLQPPKEE